MRISVAAVMPAALALVGALACTPSTGTASSESSGAPVTSAAVRGAAPSASPAPTLSEQPDRAAFGTYFTQVSSAVLPPGAKLQGPNDARPASVFNRGDQFCVSADVTQDVPTSVYAVAVYDANAKTYPIAKHAFGAGRPTDPVALRRGNNVGCETLLAGPSEPLPVGRYEYKIYLSNVLVAILPFEVR